MNLQNALADRFVSKARKERLAYLRSIPPKRLALLAVAAFTLFFAIGLLTDILNGKQRHLDSGFVMAAYMGIVPVAYIFVMARNYKLIPLVVLLQIVSVFEMSRVLSWVDLHTAQVELTVATRLYAIAALACIAAGYTLFLIFVQTEGRFALRAQTELALAHGIQKTLVPPVHATNVYCELYGVSLPSNKVGGDLVDHVALDDGGTLAYVVDIAGHGLQAGILMGMVKTAIRSCIVYNPDLAVLFGSLNRVLPEVKESQMYGTCAALLLRPLDDSAGCEVTYALAGHPSILHFDPIGQPRRELADEQFPLGLIASATFRSQTIVASSGDLLIAATDGIFETANADSLEFGTTGLCRIVAAHAALSLPSLAQKIMAAVAETGAQDDDRTLLLIRIA